jgi:hypothetical protein
VCGSGPAGIGAAVSCARKGSRVILLERYGVIGGCLTSALVGPTMGSVGKGTITTEINKLIGGDPSIKMAFDNDRAKMVLTKFVHDSGAKISLQSPIVDALMKDERIVGVVIGTHQGLRAVLGKIIIDATGDGTVSYLAGADYRKGRDEDGLMQPVSLMFRLSGLDESVLLSEGNWTYDIRMPDSKAMKWFLDFCVESSKTGELPRFSSLVRLYRTDRPNECHVNATQANIIDGTSLDHIEKAEGELREQIYTITNFLRKHVRGFEHCYVQNSASTLGVRDSRRITGEYILTEDDLLNGRKFADVAVHDAWFFMDIHNITDGGQTLTPVPNYDIPYRCFVPLKIENLLTAGRCISGTHKAEASYRIMNVCMAMGQAAGTSAALCVKEGTTPRALDYRKLQKELTDDGVQLFDA